MAKAEGREEAQVVPKTSHGAPQFPPNGTCLKAAAVSHQQFCGAIFQKIIHHPP